MPRRHSLGQRQQVLCAPLGGGVGKAGHATLVECHALDLHIAPLALNLVGEVQTGVAEGLLGPHHVRQEAQPAVPEIRKSQAVGHLGIQVDHRAVLLHGEQRPAGLAPRLAAPLAPDLGAGQEQFPQPPGVGDMAPLRLALQLHQGDEAVGPGEKAARGNIRIRNHRSSDQKEAWALGPCRRLSKNYNKSLRNRAAGGVCGGQKAQKVNCPQGKRSWPGPPHVQSGRFCNFFKVAKTRSAWRKCFFDTLRHGLLAHASRCAAVNPPRSS